MHFALSQEQQELASTVRSVLAGSPDGWKVLVEQVGAPALAVPEEYDGAGASLFETGLVLTELGASLTPHPLLQTALAIQALLTAGHHDHLADIAAGRSATVALDDVVLDGDLLLVVRDGVLHEVTAARRTPLASMDQTLALCRVEVEEDSTPLGPVDEQQLRDVGAALATAVQVGAMRECLAMTVAYTKEREQFGRPIGSFQALKHRMADCHVLLETAQSVSWAATWAAANLDDDLALKASTAKAWCGDALDQIASEMVQLHGGIAITWEHRAHHYFKRAHALGKLFGQAHEHRARLATLAR